MPPRSSDEEPGEKPGEWNAPISVSLVSQGQALRAIPPLDGRFDSYQARAEGHVYFYLDRDDGGDPIPMRVDQVAVDLYWQAPNLTRQVIRGTRKQELLPVRDFNYYIDRLTAVQNGYGDIIRIGEGRDVNDVPHPLSPQALTVYDFRLVDSLRITTHGRPPLRVMELEVRPKQVDRPGFVGSLFLDAETGGITRMTFTFTPASYIDRRVDRVDVNIEHSLWEGVWLPYRQTVEVRREIPEIQLPVATIIRATLTVDTYDFSPELEDVFFAGPSISRQTQADSVAFDSGLMEHMAAEGLTPISMADLENEVRQVARTKLLSGLPPVRFYANSASAILRMNRAEGTRIGLGLSYAASQPLRLQAQVGYALGLSRADALVRALWTPTPAPSPEVSISLFRRDLRDLGPKAGASGVFNSAATLLGAGDFTDPYFASGVRLGVRWRRSGGEWRLYTAWERHQVETPTWEYSPLRSRRFRPLPTADRGDHVLLGTRLEKRWGDLSRWGISLTLKGQGGLWNARQVSPENEGATSSSGRKSVGSIDGTITGRLMRPELGRQLLLSASGGSTSGSPPRQLLNYLGGRGTTPGYAFRSHQGRHYILFRAEGSFTLVPGILSGRLFAGTGKTMGKTLRLLVQEDANRNNTLPFVGFGLGTLHGLLRLDLAWGVKNGFLEFILSADPRLRPLL